MMLWSDVGRAILTAARPDLGRLGGPTMAVILLVTFPLNVLRVLWLAAYTRRSPGLVGREQVPRANAIFEAVFNVGWIVGPALAGLLAATIGPGATIAIDAVSFGISAVALLLVRRPLRAEARAEPTHILEDVREGIRFVVHQPTLRAVLALWTSTSVISAGLHLGPHLLHHRRPRPRQAVVGLVCRPRAGSLRLILAVRLRPRPSVRDARRAVAFGAAILLAVGKPCRDGRGGVPRRGRQRERPRRVHLAPDDAVPGRAAGPGRRHGPHASVGLSPIGSLAAGLALDAVGGMIVDGRDRGASCPRRWRLPPAPGRPAGEARPRDPRRSSPRVDRVAPRRRPRVTGPATASSANEVSLPSEPVPEGDNGSLGPLPRRTRTR